MKEDLKRIILNYGVNHQLRKFNEETFELQEAMIIYENERPHCDDIADKDFIKMLKNHIAEEIGDNFVLLYEFMEYYGITNEEIKNIMKQKIPRTISRMEKENENK